jgi:hypothetical protein
MSGCDEVESLRNMLITMESMNSMTVVVEDMKVGDRNRVSWAGLTNGGELVKMAV